MAQPQRPPPSPQQPFDSLQGTMNLLLQIIGGVISDPQKRKDPTIRQTVNRLIPEANHRFQDALDRMEDELIRAKTTLRRDLMILRAERAQQEAEAIAPKALRTAVKVPEETVNEKDMLDLTPQPTTTGELKDEGAKTEHSPEVSKVPEVTEVTALVKPVTKPADTEPEPVPEPVPVPTTTAVAAQTATTTEDKATKTLNATEDLPMDDFDDIFNADFTETSPNADDTVNSIDMSDFPDTNADVSSLLPGLQDFASMAEVTPGTIDNTSALNDDADLDFGMLDIPGQDGTAAQGGNLKKPETQAQQGSNELGGNTSAGGDGDFSMDNTFDDLFDADYELENIGDDAGSAGDLDDWMKTFN